MADYDIKNRTSEQSGVPAPGYVLGENFESRVWLKIKRKKRQRKIVTSTMLGLGVFVLAIAGQHLLLRQGRPDLADSPAPPTFQAENRQGDPDPFRRRNAAREIPVSDDVIYASSDTGTIYAIEHVACDNVKKTI